MELLSAEHYRLLYGTLLQKYAYSERVKYKIRNPKDNAMVIFIIIIIFYVPYLYMTASAEGLSTPTFQYNITP